MNRQVSGRFLKKAPQKLFALGCREFATPREAEQKSFLVTFFQKSNGFVFL
jgi:hypothetical protein